MGFNRLLVVDDSEIDRATLKNILSKDFDIIEADNGYAALEIILSGKPHIDGVLLDIFMPVLDGFNVLRLMKENRIENLPVILVTANATKPNVEKAIYYKVSNFITKPFNAEFIQERICPMFKTEKQEEVVVPRHTFSENDVAETNAYIARLKKIYSGYLRNNNHNDEPCVRTSAVAEILLSEYASFEKIADLDSSHIDMISKAAYFMDIGYMTVPDNYIENQSTGGKQQDIYESHTVAGADLVRLNHSPACQYFVKVCSDICMHHHERFDGKGYPHEMAGDENNMYVQICSAAQRFDSLFAVRKELNELQYDHVIREMASDTGEFNQKVIDLLSECQFAVISFYKKHYKKRR